MGKKLLIETHTLKSSPVQLTENVSKENGNIIVEGILASAEVKNGNGRYYSKELWEKKKKKNPKKPKTCLLYTFKVTKQWEIRSVVVVVY